MCSGGAFLFCLFVCLFVFISFSADHEPHSGGSMYASIDASDECRRRIAGVLSALLIKPGRIVVCDNAE
uniref:Secreted protein n=1 Tax=Physcomitrium patens TaxID=3218 RepID=A0A7I3ZLR1_PHYPA